MRKFVLVGALCLVATAALGGPEYYLSWWSDVDIAVVNATGYKRTSCECSTEDAIDEAQEHARRKAQVECWDLISDEECEEEWNLRRRGPSRTPTHPVGASGCLRCVGSSAKAHLILSTNVNATAWPQKVGAQYHRPSRQSKAAKASKPSHSVSTSS